MGIHDRLLDSHCPCDVCTSEGDRRGADRTMRGIREIFRDAAVLDPNGRHINGSDKQSNHNFGDAYEKIFTEYWPACPRTGPKLMMEVGVADGSSLRAWREIFPNATIVGMDIHHSDKANGERIEFYLGDQRSKEDCERAAAGRQFDLIVDDATHLLADTLVTLFWLWPFVRPGGLYVVEDGAFQDSDRAKLLFGAEVVETQGPFGGIEPLVVLRKPR